VTGGRGNICDGGDISEEGVRWIISLELYEDASSIH
jgi:hypothetical protein